MKPSYVNNYINLTLEDFKLFPWEQRTDTRLECFMSDIPQSYTYGKGKGARTYKSIPYAGFIKEIENKLNQDFLTNYNGCFLNYYLHEQHHLGWHSDDFERMDANHPITSISIGQPREIYWRPIGFKGVIPDNQKQLLESNSLFIMPEGFQELYQHKIPKGDKKMNPRISLTFRRFLNN